MRWRAAPFPLLFWAVGRQMPIIVGCDPNDIASHCSEKVIEMDNFIHLTGDSWNFWSPFPPTVTSWLIDVMGQLSRAGIIPGGS
ncbi:hypothetical protein ONE62_42735 (plasmid) [Rhodococcus opacus]|nr:hypothetical protein ONE62_42735 [Rhodococcus opacus]